MGPEWFKAPDSAQSGCIKVSTDPNHWKKTIDGMEVWWCGKCFIKKTGTSGCWTDKHRHPFTSDHRRGGRRLSLTENSIIPSSFGLPLPKLALAQFHFAALALCQR